MMIVKRNKALVFFEVALLIPISFFIGCSVSETEQPIKVRPLVTPGAINDKPKIIAFGDSLTAGFGLAEKESYPYLLQEKLKADGYDFEVVNAGVSGDTSLGGLERSDWVLDQENAKIVIIELGAND